MIVWADGFDHYASAAEMLNGAYAEASGAIQTSPVRTGTKSWNMGNGGVLRKVLPGSRTAVGVAFSIYPATLPTFSVDIGIVAFNDFSNSAQIYLRIATTGHLQVVRADTHAVIAASANPVIVANAHQHIEFYAEISNTVGKVKVRVDNVEVINVSNLDTQSTALAEVSQIRWTKTTNMSDINYDDLYIYDTLGGFNDAYPIGDMQCLPLYASADTAEADMVKVGGAVGKDLISDTSDATYLRADVAGDMSEFALDDLPVNITYIAGVYVHNRISKSDAGAAQMQAALISGASVGNGADRAMTTSPTYWGDSIEKDPATAARWTRLGVNAAKLRLTRTV